MQKELSSVCSIRKTAAEAIETYQLTEVMGGVWHIYLVGIKPGQLVRLSCFRDRINPEAGLRFNSNKLLIDPYAKAIAGQVDWDASVFSYKLGDPAEDFRLNDLDSAGGDAEMRRYRTALRMGKRPSSADAPRRVHHL